MTTAVKLYSGQATDNYRCETSDGSVFVKAYSPRSDIRAEAEAILLGEFARRGGVPVARLRRSANGSAITRTFGGLTFAVWDYVDGEASAAGLNVSQGREIGAALGHLHSRLRTYMGTRPTAPHGWPPYYPAASAAEIDGVLALLESTGKDAFTTWAVQTLRHRRALIPQVNSLLDGMPLLESQELHGDMSSPNVLFRGSGVAALVDFSPAISQLCSWEIGRIACDPQTILNNHDWLEYVGGLGEAYLTCNQQSAPQNVIFCVRIWICATVLSTVAIRRIFTGTAALPELFMSYAVARHEAMVAVLDRLAEVEATLAERLGGR